MEQTDHEVGRFVQAIEEIGEGGHPGVFYKAWQPG